MHKLVLLRHGESVWNRENRFTGWTDVELSSKGMEEAVQAGAALLKEGFVFDIAYTSFLRRAIRTLWLVLDVMDLAWIGERKDWRLNERHYGALQGLDKAETALKYGDEQVKIWRRSYDAAPPLLSKDDPRYPGREKRYRGLGEREIPLGESLKDTIARFMPCWNDIIAPDLRAGRKPIIVAHGNSLRALVKHLDGVSDSDIVGVEIPTGAPLVYELDNELKPLKHYYLPIAKERQKAG